MKTIFLFLWCLTIQYVSADVIVTSTAKYYGKITSINDSTISIIEGCQNTTSKIFWNLRTSVNFNEQCNPPKGETSASPLIRQPKCNNKTLVFELRFRDVKSPFYCSSISFDGNDFSFVLYNGSTFLLRDFLHNKNIDYLSYSMECTDSIKPPEIIPNSLQQFTAKLSPVNTSKSTLDSCTVRLKAPLNNAELPNQFIKSDGHIMGNWSFSWFPCPRATKYHLYVIGIIPGWINNPLINDSTITTTTYFYNRGPVSLSKGWKWKVRAYVGGHWGEWTESRSFDVAPRNCIITGHIFGPLQGESFSDVGGEHHTVKMKEVFLFTTDRKLVKRARLHGREYFFDNVPTGKTYWIYPDSRFNSTPSPVVIPNTVPRMYEGMNLTITGVKSDG